MGDVGARLTGIAARSRLAGAILAGGNATRLGGIAKGLLDVGGRRIIDRVADALAPLVDSIVVASNSPDANSWLPNAMVVADILEGGGSAAGVHAVLRATRKPTLVVAWDMPFVSTALLRTIASAAQGDIDAAVPAGPGAGEFEPLCAWYAPICANEIESGWETGDRSLHGLLRRVPIVVIPAETIATVGSPERFFLNVNAPEDLDRARRMAADDSETKPA